MRSVPFSLKVPYRPEDYGGPEAMVLRVDAADFPDVLSAIRQHRSGEG